MAEAFTFDVEQDRKANQRMTGERFNASETGSELGMTTDTPDEAEQQRIAVTTPDPEVTEPAEEVARLKKIIGDQGNVVGENRRLAAENDAMRQRMDRIEARAAEAPVQQAPVTPQNFDLFAGIPEEATMMSPMERQAMSNFAVNYSQATQQYVDQQVANAIYQSTKTASGITEAEERELTLEHPYINKLSGADRARALGDLHKAKAGAAGATTRTQQEVVNQAANLSSQTQNYVEPSSPGSGESEVSLEPAQEKLLRQYRAGKIKNAEQSEEALRKLGIARADTYGRNY